MNKYSQEIKRGRKSVRRVFFLQSFIKNCMLILIPLLIIGPYSIFKSMADNTRMIENSTAGTLMQLDSTVESLFSHMDNANMFFASSPSVTLQLDAAFHEESLSLDTLRNIENISLYFRNLLYTNSFLENIYIYYNNDYNRIYLPPQSSVRQISDPVEQELVSIYRDAGERDFWVKTMETSGGRLVGSRKSLYMFQKLYRRSTAYVSGFIAFEYNQTKLEEYIGSILQYRGQKLYLLSSDGQIAGSNETGELAAEEAAGLLSLLEGKEEKQLFDAQTGGKQVKAAYVRSARTNGFTYLTYTPADEIYRTTRSLSASYILLTLVSLLISLLAAFYKTNREYQNLNRIVEIFSDPSGAQVHFQETQKSHKNLMEYVTMNIIRLFIEQDYLKMEASALKLQALQYQINPHFLQNTLNTIYWESIRLTGSENQCSVMTNKLSSMMRYALGNSEEDVPLSMELLYLEKYLDIMKLRYPDKIQVIFRINCSRDEVHVKKMLLQPLVENAIYHGAREKEGICRIYIGALQLSSSVLIYVLDDGMGIKAGRLAEIKEELNLADRLDENHIGLYNTAQRIRMAYKEERKLRIKSSEGKYTCVYFSIPMPEAKKND